MTALMPRDRKRSRYLFDWSARYAIERGSLDAITGQVASFTRATGGYALDSAGRWYRATHSEPRFQWEDRDGDGVREYATLLLEATSANLIAQPDDFSTGAGWSQVGVTSVTPNAATFAGLKFCRIVGSASTTQISRAVTFTGDGVKCYSISIRPQPGVNGKDAFVIFDNTASANKLVVIITITNGVVTAAASTGSIVLEKSLADGVYRGLMATTAITASHSHSVWVSDIGGTSAGTGAGGVTDRFYACAQVENAPFPSSPMPSGLLTRNADQLAFPYAALPSALSLYASVIERSPGASVHRLAGLSTSASSAFDLYRSPTVGVAEWSGLDSNGAAQVTMTDPSFGDLLEMCGSWNADGQTAPLSAAVKIEARINGGAIAAATNAAGSRQPVTWTDPNVYFNGNGGVSYGVGAVRIGARVQPLIYMCEG